MSRLTVLAATAQRLVHGVVVLYFCSFVHVQSSVYNLGDQLVTNRQRSETWTACGVLSVSVQSMWM